MSFMIIITIFVSQLFIAIRCNLLVNPDNGFVKFSGVTVGATGSYACNRGNTLRGNTVRVCLPNGEWSGEVPTCSG